MISNNILLLICEQLQFKKIIKISLINKKICNFINNNKSYITVNLSNMLINNDILKNISNYKKIILNNSHGFDSIGMKFIKNAHYISLKNCYHITDIYISHLKNIKKINLLNCKKITNEGIKHLSNVKIIHNNNNLNNNNNNNILNNNNNFLYENINYDPFLMQ